MAVSKYAGERVVLRIGISFPIAQIPSSDLSYLAPILDTHHRVKSQMAVC